MVVVGQKRTPAERNAVNFHQTPCRPCVFRRDHVRDRQRVERPQGDVARRSDRRGDEMKPRGERRGRDRRIAAGRAVAPVR
jgi:hypothetical protein